MSPMVHARVVPASATRKRLIQLPKPWTWILDETRTDHYEVSFKALAVFASLPVARYISNSDAATAQLIADLSEATLGGEVRRGLMLASSQPKVTKPTGIKGLRSMLAELVEELAEPELTEEQTARVALRYGIARDVMAELRRTFQEVEGMLEVVQHQVVEKMSG